MIRHKLLTAVAAVLLLPMAAGAQTLRGDFNMDGQVNISDVTAMANYLSTGTLGEVSPADRDTLTVNGVPFVMVRVKGGTYSLKYGKVRTIPDFWIGETEVTCDLWWAVMGRDNHPFGGLGCAMRGLTWFDCQAFVDSMNRLTGKNFRLPYADEWRFAASGGTLTRGHRYSGSDNLDEVGWYSSNTVDLGYSTRYISVASKAPNELGLYDMSGDVAEVVQEMKESTGNAGEVYRIYWAFGGHADSNADECRPTSWLLRSENSIQSAIYGCGMRLAIPTSDEPWEFIEWPGSY